MRKTYKTSQQNKSQILKISTCIYGNKQSGNAGMENHPCESHRGLGMAVTPMGAVQYRTHGCHISPTDQVLRVVVSFINLNL